MDATPYRTSSTSTALDPPSSLPPNMARRWARKLERYCCTCVTYFPLAFVYSITSWAVYVDVSLSTTPSGVTWLGRSTPLLPSQHRWCVMLTILFSSAQASPMASSPSFYTSWPTGAIHMPSSLRQGALPMTMATAPSLHRHPLLPPHLPSSPMANSDFARSARHESLTALITARHAAAAS